MEKSRVALVRDSGLLVSSPKGGPAIRDLAFQGERIERMVARAFELSGFDFADRIARTRKERPVVVLKVNATAVAPPEDLSTTDPRLVRAVCVYLLSQVPRGSQIELLVADNCAFGEAGLTSNAFATSLIAAAAAEGGAELRPLDLMPHHRTNPRFPATPLVMKTVNIFEVVDSADILINLPKMKVIVDQIVSLGLKNWVGVIPAGSHIRGERHTAGRQESLDQQGYHRADLCMKVVDIHQVREPDFTLIDGIWALEGQGPWFGQRRIMNLLVASSDVVAVDATACRCMGIDPLEIGEIRVAAQLGIGVYEEDKIDLRFEELSPDIEVMETDDTDFVSNEDIRRVRQFFRRPSHSPVAVAKRVHLHVGGTCIGCLANIRGGLDTLVHYGFPFERMTSDVHIVAGMDVSIPAPLDGHVIVVGDCATLRLDFPDEAHSERVRKSVLDTVNEAVPPGVDVDVFPGCAPVAIFDELVEWMAGKLSAPEQRAWRQQNGLL